jgi:phosphonate transport system ATP-binding protein
MLVLDRVSRCFGPTVAVSNVSIEIQPGSFVGVIGRSGAGKSSLLRMINRLIDPSEGRIIFGDIDVTSLRGRTLREWRARAAMIFQQFNLVPRLDVLTNVLLGRLSRRRTLPSLFSRFTAAERVMAVELLDRFDLVAHAFQRAGTLSGGQQQRVAIARALMQEPSILLADEPIASLDPRNAAGVMDALRAINRDEGLTILCNLHTLDAAREYCERIIGMAKGRIVFDGAPSQLTLAVVRRIYQVEGQEGDLPEAVTSNVGWSIPSSEIAAAPA